MRKKALKVLDDFEPQIILMDVQLTGMDGLELTRRLKADPRRQDIVIIALTAYAMKGDEEKVRAAGADCYLSKPVDADPAGVDRKLSAPAFRKFSNKIEWFSSPTVL